MEMLRAATGRRRSDIKPSVVNGQESASKSTRQRRPSLVEILRAATGRRPSEVKSSAVNGQESRKRGPSLVAKAKEFLNHPRTNTNPEQSFRRLPDQLSRHDEAASETEKLRLSIEAATRSFDLIQRWKDPTDWLKPSAYWKRKHPAMNFRLWRIIQRNPRNNWKLQGLAEREFIAAKLLYEQKGGDSDEWWPVDLEEDILDSWSLGFGGHDPPPREWKLEE